MRHPWSKPSGMYWVVQTHVDGGEVVSKRRWAGRDKNEASHAFIVAAAHANEETEMVALWDPDGLPIAGFGTRPDKPVSAEERRAALKAKREADALPGGADLLALPESVTDDGDAPIDDP